MAKQNPGTSSKTCVIVTGPTAVGKTSLAINIAQYFNTEIISADSRQCYRELNIGVAKPSAEELKTIPHHFIDSHSIHDEMNAGVFEDYALQKAANIFKEKDILVMAGGTGLYINAFCEGMDSMPAIPRELRNEIIQLYSQFGLTGLQEHIKIIDPLYYSKGEIQNPQRIMRVLEVVRYTGKSILEFRKQQKKQRDFSILKVGLEMPREDLYNRIDKRVDEMLDAGLVAEAKTLLPYSNLNALQTVGYRELFDYFNQKISLEKAITLIKQNTRHYAKRQLTWFKRDLTINWFNNLHFDKAPEVIKLISG